MSWEQRKNVLRIFNTFKRLKDKIYIQDKEALESLNNSVLNASKQHSNNNLLFAKLLALSIRQNLHYYGSVKMAIKGISSELVKPINFQLEMLTMELNQRELNHYFNSIGIVDWKNSKELESNNIITNEKQKEIIEKLTKNWSFENVETSFYSSANDILKEINNYK